MRTLVAFVFLALVATHTVASAQDAEWKTEASVVSGSPRNCGQGPWHLKAAIKGQTYSVVGDRFNFSINIASLKPDGSGRVVGKNEVGNDIYFDFDSGAGPRKIRFSRPASECVYLLSLSK
jgi:hypothetical protein